MTSKRTLSLIFIYHYCHCSPHSAPVLQAQGAAERQDPGDELPPLRVQHGQEMQVQRSHAHARQCARHTLSGVRQTVLHQENDAPTHRKGS